MASIMTNAAAMTALQTLNQTNKSLEETQNRISTGYRVAEASDNAAYWSIATTMRSDNKALSTAQDALGLGAATVDVAYTAMNSVKDNMDEIKTKLVAAKQPGVDRGKIQSEIAQIQEQIEGTASAATFSGSNWLSVDSESADYDRYEKVVSSFSRSSNGSLDIATIDVDITTTTLFDAGGTGMLEGGEPLAEDGGLQDDAGAGDDTDPALITAFSDVSGGLTFEGEDAMQFDVEYNGETRLVSIDKSVVDAALGNGDGAVTDADDMATVVEYALQEAGFDTDDEVSAAANGNAVELTHEGGVTTEDTLAVSNSGTTDNGNFFSLMDIDIANVTSADLDRLIEGLDEMTGDVTTAASDLGAYKKRVDLQSEFVDALMDAIDRGVGQLVDADMNEESTRLQALQTQQQLGIQSLSIANQNAQSILSLFQG